MPPSRLTRLGLGLVGGVTLVLGGVLAAALLLMPGQPQSLQPGVAPTSVPVVATAFTDERAVSVTARIASDRSLRSPAAGRVTAFACTPGGAIESGRSLLSVDGRPILNLATSVPLWRDLTAGSSGDDVVALQSELVRLGHPLDVDGKVGPATLSAFDAALESIGASADVIAVRDILWLPAPSVVVGGCTVGVGDPVSDGDAVAELPAALVSVAVDLPAELLPGDRELALGGMVVPIAADGRVTDPAVLSRPDLLAAIGGDPNSEDRTAPGTLRLVQPVEVVSVPPRALYAIDEDAACVSTEGRPIAVRIAGSQLGQTFVIVEGEPPATVDTPPIEVAPCR